jgi:hypothetical protein
MYDIAQMRMALLKTLAKARQQEGGAQGGATAGRGRPKQASSNLEEAYHNPVPRKDRESRTIAAESVGAKPTTFREIAEVVEAARAEPDKYGGALDRLNLTGNAQGK